METKNSKRNPPTRSVSRRRFIAAAGASGLAAGLAGCAASGKRGDSNTVQWLAGTNEKGASEDIKKALYNAGLSRDITLEIISGPSNTSTKKQQLQRWLDAEIGKPDLIEMDSGWMIPFIVRDQVLNLTKSEVFPDSLVQKVESDYFEASVKTAKDPQTGDLYGVPLFPDFPTLLYRRDLVEKAGYNPKKENWAKKSITWKKFARVTRDVLDQNNDLQYGYTFQASSYEGLSCCDFNEFMSSWGGAYFGGQENLFGPIGKRPVTIDTKAVTDSIRMVRTFIEGPNAPNTLSDYPGPISPRAVLAWTEQPSLAPFSKGRAVANRNWSYAILQTGAKDVFGNRLGVMPIPYAVTKQESQYKNIGGPTAALGGWNNAINPYSENVEKCVQVLEAMAKPSFKYKMFELLGYIPPEPDLLNSQKAKQTPIIGDYVEQLQIAGKNAIPRPVTTVWPQESTKISQHVNNAYGGGITPKQAAETLQSEIKKIENYNGS